MMRKTLVIMGAGLVLAGCSKESQPVAPVAKPSAPPLPASTLGTNTATGNQSGMWTIAPND